MLKKNMPAAPRASRPRALTSEVCQKAMSLWDGTIIAKEPESKQEDATISILDVIGYDPWTGEGVTAKRIAAALRTIGDREVTVSINSPGGDMFEGLAIYNLLREHKQKVTVKVLGIAASAASVVAMAGDEVQIARAGFLMIHNAWVLAAGNRNDLREMADFLEPFDRAMADIYSARSGMDIDDVQELMDDETYIGGSDAIDQGFADSLLASDEIDHKAKASAGRTLDSVLAKAGVSRQERRKLINNHFKAVTPRADEDNTPRAVVVPQLSPNISPELRGIFS